MISVRFQCKPFSTTVIQVYAPTTNVEKAERFYENLQDLLDLTPKKRCPFHHRWLVSKSRKSRDTWSNRQIWLWSTETSRAKANGVCQENAWVTANTLFQQYRDDSTHGHHQMVNTKIRLIIFFAAKDGEAPYSKQNKTRSWLWFRWIPYCKIQT